MTAEQLVAQYNKTTSATDDTVTTDITFVGPVIEGQQEVFNSGAVAFLNSLCAKFAAEVPELLTKRKQKQTRIDAGELPDFLPETRAIRDGDWTIRGIPEDFSPSGNYRPC